MKIPIVMHSRGHLPHTWEGANARSGFVAAAGVVLAAGTTSGVVFPVAACSKITPNQHPVFITQFTQLRALVDEENTLGGEGLSAKAMPLDKEVLLKPKWGLG
jgi:hypothetical protein